MVAGYNPDGAVRAAVFGRLTALSTPHVGVTREGCLAGDLRMLEGWEEELEGLW